MSKRYINWTEYQELVLDVVQRIVHHMKDHKCNSSWITILGVPRGGLFPANMVAGILKSQHPHWTVDVGSTDAIPKNDSSKIVVDDLIDSGATRDRFLDYPFFALIDKRTHPTKRWIVFPWETYSQEETVEDNITRILQYIGEDPNREGLKDTPSRVVKSYAELFSGYQQDPQDLMTTFEAEQYDEIVLCKDIEFYSTCEHHMLPFTGKAHVAYIPKERVIGLSKLARMVDIYSRRLQNQERLTWQVAEALNQGLRPDAVGVVMQAKHHCMCARGVGKQGSTMSTSYMIGKFRTNQAARQELFSLIGR